MGPGIWVTKFGFKPRDPEPLAEQYECWTARRGERQDAPDDPAMYPMDFLNSRTQLLLYKVLG
jgi:hypothetical protein